VQAVKWHLSYLGSELLSFAPAPEAAKQSNMEADMNLFYQDFERRFLNVAHPVNTKSTDAEVINEIAQLWIDSGGESSGLTDEYVGMLRAEIKRLEGAK
jgi:hypothetical protein